MHRLSAGHLDCNVCHAQGVPWITRCCCAALIVACGALWARAGHAGTVYRSTYKVVNDKGRVVMATHSYTTLPPEEKGQPVVYYNTQGADRPLLK
jgi:hypothetical protein